jgi:hypothetical protein
MTRSKADRLYPWEFPRAALHREAIGRLLRQTDLPLTEIARRVGVTASWVCVLQRKYFPEFPRTRWPQEQATQHRQIIGELLRNPCLSLTEIGRRIGLTRERVRQIQQQHFPEFPRPRGAKR